eukprot:TRINITY_DN4635_c2_g1_i1.p1 TRINITY_DN4635_c2_g1~~TRINITY_DN4635_c2_g1_i1.p1  ORF type:complete len:323 (+),score=58.75 TRINITY_DN4635_c2_g1_i1:43-1011(+)
MNVNKLFRPKNTKKPAHSAIQVAHKGDLLGESPFWCSKSNRLYWVDILGRRVHYLNPADHSTATISTGKYNIGCIATVSGKNGVLAAAGNEGVGFLNLKSGAFTKIYDPENHKPSNRFNDGKCDAKGRFLVGSMYGTKPRKERTANLYSWDGTTNRVTKLDEVGPVTTSNGIGWSPDGKTIYYIDSPTMSVQQFDYDIETGRLSNQQKVITIPKEFGGAPDGMCVDVEGKLWIALFRGGKVTRWDPTTGDLLSTINLPCPHVTSCCFGGPDLDKLYITTAKGSSASEIKENNNTAAGAVFMCEPGVKGLPMHEFISKKASKL